MSRITEIFPTLVEGASEDEFAYIESYIFIGKTPDEWIIEAENHPELLSDHPDYFGEPVSHTIMTMARTAIIRAREEYKNL